MVKILIADDSRVYVHLITGWLQDKKSGQWTSEAKPDSETLERTLTFNLDQAPKGK